jgi:hypothetical protein
VADPSKAVLVAAEPKSVPAIAAPVTVASTPRPIAPPTPAAKPQIVAAIAPPQTPAQPVAVTAKPTQAPTQTEVVTVRGQARQQVASLSIDTLGRGNSLTITLPRRIKETGARRTP